jgi:hypothetical protein
MPLMCVIGDIKGGIIRVNQDKVAATREDAAMARGSSVAQSSWEKN